MFEKLIFLLAALTLLLFIVNIAYKGNSVQSCLLFILSLLPLMDLKILPEAWGGFKTFDAICLYCLVFLFKDFISINIRSRNNFYFFLFVSLSVIVLIGGLASEFPDRAYLNLIKTFPVFIFGRFLLTECIKDTSFFHRVINALKISYVTALVFLALQVIFGLKFTFYPGLAPNTTDPVFQTIRYPGIFYDSQAHGQFLMMGSFLFLYTENTGRKRLINYLIFFFIIAGILVAGSRAALGGFIIGMLVVLIMAAKRFRIYGISVVLITIILLSIFPKAGIFDRAKNLSEDYLFRQSIWKEAFEISKKHPFLGIGSGNYQGYVMRHAQNQYLELEEGKLIYFDQPENGYLKIMVELGFIGFTLFALFILIPLFKGFIFRFKNLYDKQIVFIMASLISWMIAFNTVYSIYDNRLLIMVASMVVLIIAYPRLEFTDGITE